MEKYIIWLDKIMQENLKIDSNRFIQKHKDLLKSEDYNNLLEIRNLYKIVSDYAKAEYQNPVYEKIGEIDCYAFDYPGDFYYIVLNGNYYKIGRHFPNEDFLQTYYIEKISKNEITARCFDLNDIVNDYKSEEYYDIGNVKSDIENIVDYLRETGVEDNQIKKLFLDVLEKEKILCRSLKC